MNHTDLGTLGEGYVYHLLYKAGFDVAFDGPADLLANQVPIEVKTAQETPHCYKYHGYQFCVHRKGRNGLRAPILVLLCIPPDDLEPVAFVLPRSAVGTLKKLHIPNSPLDYNGKWAKYREKWSLLTNLTGGNNEHPREN